MNRSNKVLREARETLEYFLREYGWLFESKPLLSVGELPEVYKIAKGAGEEYKLEVARGGDGNFYVFVSLEGRAREYYEAFEKFKNNLKEFLKKSYFGFRKIFEEYPVTRNEKELSNSVKKLRKEIKKDAKRYLKEIDRIYKKLHERLIKIGKEVKKEIYKVLSGYELKVETEKKPMLYVVASSDLDEVFASYVAYKIREDIHKRKEGIFGSLIGKIKGRSALYFLENFSGVRAVRAENYQSF